MSELAQVAAALREAAARDEATVLATVVRTDGSTYRRIGARLVAGLDGVRAGAVSAGCLEGDVIARAAEVLAVDEPVVVTYDSRSSDDLIWGFGLGCGGLVEVLLEPLAPRAAATKSARLATLAGQRQRTVLATVIRSPGTTRLRAGDQAVADASGTLDGFDVVDASLRDEIAEAARATLRHGRSGAVQHDWVGEHLDIAYEIVVPTIRLTICGAGIDALPVAGAAKRMGWHVTLIDDRPGMARADRWRDVDRILVADPRRIDAAVGAADCDAAIVMSHNFERDLEFLGAWITGHVPYIGVLGPRRRTEQMLAALESRGIPIDEDARERIRGPVGLDIGAETAEEIALSIVAEVQAVQAGRDGGVLSHYDGPIHA